MSLFSRLLKLNKGSIPLEDFFTELVAYLFKTDHEILTAWLQQHHLLDLPLLFNSDVSTQREFSALQGHNSASRPDITIELWRAHHRSIVFIESKIGSHEGYQQLPRYLEILHHLPGFQQKLLLYITRDFDPKESPQLFKNLPDSTVQFKQLRWHQFYHFLDAYKDRTFVQEILTFMEEYRMAQNNQFSSIDVIAMTNFLNALRLMEEIVWGDVKKKFEEILGGSKKQAAAMTQIQRHGRYIIDVDMPGKWSCKLGFILNRPNFTDYPKVFLMLEIAPNSSHRKTTIKVMQDICSSDAFPNWEARRLNEPGSWASIRLEKSLQEFLAKEDHVQAIQEFFIQSLDELRSIKNKYSNLPWGVIPEIPETLDVDEDAAIENGD